MSLGAFHSPVFWGWVPLCTKKDRARIILGSSTEQDQASSVRVTKMHSVLRVLSVVELPNKWKGLPGRTELLYLNLCTCQVNTSEHLSGTSCQKGIPAFEELDNSYLLNTQFAVGIAYLGAGNLEVIKSTPSCQVAGRTQRNGENVLTCAVLST